MATAEISAPNPPSLQETPAPSLFSLKDKHALVTGGTRGIGAACALALAQAGASVCLAVRPGVAALESHPALQPLSAYTSATQRHVAVECDLSDMDSVKGLFDRALQTSEMDGRVDILVNCGGIQRRHPAVDFPEEDWDEVRGRESGKGKRRRMGVHAILNV